MYIKFAKFDLLHNCTMQMMLQDSIMIMCPRWWQGGAGPGTKVRVMSYGAETQNLAAQACWLLVLGEVSVLIAGTIASTLGPTHFILHSTV